MKREKLYLSTMDENAHLLAKQYGLGIEFVEFCTPWFLDDEFPAADKQVREKMKCSDRYVIHGPFSELFPCAIDPKVRQMAAERYRQVIQVASAYGIKKIVLHGGYNPRIYYPIWYTEQSVVFWKSFVEEIPEDVVICLENVFEEEPDMIGEILRQVNNPRLRMCLDMGHVNAYSAVPAKHWLDCCGDWIDHVHVHNNNTLRDSHSPLPEGTLPIRRLLTQLEERCPEATVTIELMDAQSSVRWLLEE